MPIYRGSTLVTPFRGSVPINSGFRGTSAFYLLDFTRTISTNQSNFNIANYLAGEGITTGNVELTLNADFIGTSADGQGLLINHNPSLINLTLILTSAFGAFGKGGLGGGASLGFGPYSDYVLDTSGNERGRFRASDGQAGGSAMRAVSPVSIIDNGGEFRGGGGGGGTAEITQEETSSADIRYGGAGGAGGGAGASSGMGGTAVAVFTDLMRGPGVGTHVSQSADGAAGSDTNGGSAGRFGSVELLLFTIGQQFEYAVRPGGGPAQRFVLAGAGGPLGAAGSGITGYDVGSTLGADIHVDVNAAASGGAGGAAIAGNSLISWTNFTTDRKSGAIVG